MSSDAIQQAIVGGSVEQAPVVEGGLKACKAYQVRRKSGKAKGHCVGTKTSPAKGSRALGKRSKRSKKSAKRSKRSMRGGDAAVDVTLTAGALEQAFQAGLEAGARRRRHRMHGGDVAEVPAVEGGAVEGGNWMYRRSMQGGEAPAPVAEPVVAGGEADLAVIEGGRRKRCKQYQRRSAKTGHCVNKPKPGPKRGNAQKSPRKQTPRSYRLRKSRA